MRHPVLYSFRRCPYAMRARLAIIYSEQTVELREVELKNKPSAMLCASPKGTVPVLLTPESVGDGSVQVLDESLDIMLWALSQNDPNSWRPSEDEKEEVFALITQNDSDFKHCLDRYKYADRFPEHTQDFYRSQAEKFLDILEQRLQQNSYLFSTNITIADVAIFPFIRQFAHVDKAWFDQASYPKLQQWLMQFMEGELFLSIMKKYVPWTEGDTPILFNTSLFNTSVI